MAHGMAMVRDPKDINRLSALVRAMYIAYIGKLVRGIVERKISIESLDHNQLNSCVAMWIHESLQGNLKNVVWNVFTWMYAYDFE